MNVEPAVAVMFPHFLRCNHLCSWRCLILIKHGVGATSQTGTDAITGIQREIVLRSHHHGGSKWHSGERFI